MPKFPCYKQLDAMDCGPTCLRMVTRYYGREFSINDLRRYCDIQRTGVTMAQISEAAEHVGLNTLGVKIGLADLENKDIPYPCILHWRQSHFVVLFKVRRGKYTIGDPAIGKLMTLDNETFRQQWLGEAGEAIALLIETTPKFFEIKDELGLVAERDTTTVSWSTLWKYLSQYKRYFFQVILGLLAASFFQLLIPFLTQSIVDKGVNMQNVNFVYVVLMAQMLLLIARFIVEFSRQGLLLFISANINLALLTDFWKKLMRLPVAYFDSKQTGDILQRIGDQQRIERFLTGNSISIAFSVVNLVIYSLVMLTYSIPVFLIFVAGSILYVFWISLFLRQRRKLNYKQFAIASKENNATMQLIYGMQEIKMHNAEKYFRWIWERLQRGLFKLSFKNLSLAQTQQAGAILINEGKNLVVTGVVATAVIEGKLTLGAMLAIQYILGALNNPIQQFTSFIQEFQDAKISLERLNEIHKENDEPQQAEPSSILRKGSLSINIKDLSFGYSRQESSKVLRNINLDIPGGKVTAVVGMSGSGKTTLLKILQKYYDDRYFGTITVQFEQGQEGSELRKLIPAEWRNTVGSVMQDGYIFSLSIAENIAVGEEFPDEDRLKYAAKMANILSFIETLPLGFKTQIGTEGTGISKGQIQRLLIARAIYKDPKLMLFDEATNSLDANNELAILNNLDLFFKGRTVVVVAHRLSTVKNADKIVVLNNGEIVEEGTHTELTLLRGQYFELVKNQLELGNS